MAFICRRCSYTSTTKSNLIKHLRRKQPCDVTNEDICVTDYIAELLHKEYNEKTWDCKYCDCKFNSYQNRWRHEKTCKERHEARQSELSELKDRIIKLEQQVLKTHTTNIQTINNYNFNLNNFGNESHSHITNEFMSDCIKKSVNGVRSLIEKIHFSPEVPENRNVRLRSIKNNLVEVATNQKWIVKDTNEALETMIRNGQRILSGYFYNPDSGLFEKELSDLDTRIQEFLNSIIDKNSRHYFELRRRILALIIEHSDSI